MKVRYGIFLYLLFLSWLPATHAALMQTTWTSTVSENDLTSDAARALFTPGEVFTLVAVYDNASKLAIEYSDGPNQIAEFGEGDDILLSSMYDSVTFRASL